MRLVAYATGVVITVKVHDVSQKEQTNATQLINKVTALFKRELNATSSGGSSFSTSMKLSSKQAENIRGRLGLDNLATEFNISFDELQGAVLAAKS